VLFVDGSREDVEPLEGLGAEMRACAPPDFAEAAGRDQPCSMGGS
jgi:hypothetical protein